MKARSETAILAGLVLAASLTACAPAPVQQNWVPLAPAQGIFVGTMRFSTPADAKAGLLVAHEKALAYYAQPSTVRVKGSLLLVLMTDAANDSLVAADNSSPPDSRPFVAEYARNTAAELAAGMPASGTFDSVQVVRAERVEDVPIGDADYKLSVYPRAGWEGWTIEKRGQDDAPDVRRSGQIFDRVSMLTTICQMYGNVRYVDASNTRDPCKPDYATLLGCEIFTSRDSAKAALDGIYAEAADRLRPVSRRVAGSVLIVLPTRQAIEQAAQESNMNVGTMSLPISFDAEEDEFLALPTFVTRAHLFDRVDVRRATDPAAEPIGDHDYKIWMVPGPNIVYQNWQIGNRQGAAMALKRPSWRYLGGDILDAASKLGGQVNDTDCGGQCGGIEATPPRMPFMVVVSDNLGLPSKPGDKPADNLRKMGLVGTGSGLYCTRGQSSVLIP